MATPQLHVAKNGARSWKVRYRHRGKHTSQTFYDERAASRFCTWLSKYGVDGALEVLQTHLDSKSDDHHTVKTWCLDYIAHLTGVTSGTTKRYKAYVNNDLKGLADLPLDALTKRTIAAWVKKMETAGASGKTIKNKHGFLSAALAAAVDAELIPSNPAHKTRLPRSIVEEKPTLNDQELAIFVGYFKLFWIAFVEVLFGTGMRWGEITALQVRDFNEEAGTLTITRAWKETGSGREIGPPKSKKSRRTIWLAPQTILVLAAQCENKQPDDLIFTDEKNRPITGQYFHTNVWRPAVDAAEPKLGKRLAVHDARHSYASELLRRGAPITYVQNQLGHESITTTVNTYGHIQPAAQEVMVSLLSQYLTPTRPELLPSDHPTPAAIGSQN